MTVPAPASSAIVTREDRYLLVRRRNPPAADLYAFPGGRAEAGETPEAAAIRECAEETGILIADPELFATYDLVTRAPDGSVSHHFFLSVFRAREVGQNEALAADDALDCGWYSAAEIRNLPVPESVQECIDRLEKARLSGEAA
jgi:ADP-ribose pyrophosphatase YjhB (NUDIX family)